MAAMGSGKFHPGAFQVSIITLFWGAFLWLTLAHLGQPLTALLRWTPLRWIGGISYGVYLFHPLVNNLLFARVLGGLPSHEMGSAGLPLACVSFALTLAISAASFYLVERRLIAIGHRYRSGPPALSA